MALWVRHRWPDGLWARATAMLVSGWLVFSAFAWERGDPRIDGAVVGYLIFVFSILGTLVDEVRVLNTLLGGWLVVTAWIWPAKALAMRGNDTLVGVAVLLLSMVSSRGDFHLPSLRRFLVRLEGPRHAH